MIRRVVADKTSLPKPSCDWNNGFSMQSKYDNYIKQVQGELNDFEIATKFKVFKGLYADII